MLAELTAFYERVTEPNHTVTMEDLIEIAKFRSRARGQLTCASNIEVAIINQRLRELNHGMPCSPTHFLSMKKKPASKEETSKIKLRLRALMEKDNVKNHVLYTLLPLDTVEEAMTAISYIYVLIVAKNNAHLTYQQPLPAN